MSTVKQLFKIRPEFGAHRENGVTYKAGDIISSTNDLAKIFPHKFERVTLVPIDAQADKTLQLDGSFVAEYEPSSRSSAALLEAIAKVSVDDPVLVEVEEISNDDFIARTNQAKIKKPVDEQSKNKIDSGLGDDVTKQYPIALNLELLVYKTKNNKYVPVDPDLPNYPLHAEMEEVELLNWLNNQD